MAQINLKETATANLVAPSTGRCGLAVDGSGSLVLVDSAGNVVTFSATEWGNITGTLSNQTDLQDELDGKEDSLGFTPEDVANKKTDLSDNSDDYYASQKAVKTALDGKQNNYTTESITIAVGDWSGLTATKTVPGVTATNLILLGFNKANGDLLGDFNVKMDSQDTNKLTFKADEVPEEDINLTIVIFD